MFQTGPKDKNLISSAAHTAQTNLSTYLLAFLLTEQTAGQLFIQAPCFIDHTWLACTMHNLQIGTMHNLQIGNMHNLRI